jgi:hypothetical protein
MAAIVHAGDIGADPVLLYELETIAPVTAVLGNCDAGLPGFDLAAIARLRIADKTILVIHDLADLGPIPEDVDVVVRGHSHAPSVQWHGQVLIVTPDRRRSGADSLAARSECSNSPMTSPRVLASCLSADPRMRRGAAPRTPQGPEPVQLRPKPNACVPARWA